MAKATVARSDESSPIPPPAWDATGAARPGAGAPRPDLLTTAVLAALDVALEVMRSPALIADWRGKIVCANARARALLGGGSPVPPMAPAAQDRGGPRDGVWEATPIGAPGLPAWSLLVCRPPEVPPRRRWNLTARQSEVLDLVARGLPNTGIAASLGIRLGTVEFHVSAIFDKVGVNSRAALIASLISG